MVLGKPLAQDGGEPGGALDVGQVSAVGEQREPPVGQAVHGGLGLGGGRRALRCALHGPAAVLSVPGARSDAPAAVDAGNERHADDGDDELHQ